MDDGGAVPYQETLIAIASVSAIFWTGGLIVLQLRLQSPSNDPYKDATRGGMAALAFGALAPLFALVVAGETFRALAIAFSVFYFVLTWRNVGLIIKGLVELDRLVVLTAVGFIGPTVAMVIAAFLPQPKTVVFEALALDFLGYYILSESVGSRT